MSVISARVEILRDAFWLEDFGRWQEIPVAETVRRESPPEHEPAAAHRLQGRSVYGHRKGRMREVMTLGLEPSVHHFRIVESGHLGAG